METWCQTCFKIYDDNSPGMMPAHICRACLKKLNNITQTNKTIMQTKEQNKELSEKLEVNQWQQLLFFPDKFSATTSINNQQTTEDYYVEQYPVSDGLNLNLQAEDALSVLDTLINSAYSEFNIETGICRYNPELAVKLELLRQDYLKLIDLSKNTIH